MLYNNIKEKIYTAEGSLEGAFFRIAWPPSWGPWFLSSSCCSIFGGSELRARGVKVNKLVEAAIQDAWDREFWQDL